MAITDRDGQPVTIIAAVEMDGLHIIRLHDQSVTGLACLRGEFLELWEAYREVADRTDPKAAMKLRTDYREMMAWFQAELERETNNGRPN